MRNGIFSSEKCTPIFSDDLQMIGFDICIIKGYDEENKGLNNSLEVSA